MRYLPWYQIENYAAPPPPEDAPPDDDLAEAQIEALARLVASLPPDSQALLAQVAQGATPAQIARQRRCSRSHVVRSIRRSIAYLRRLRALGYLDAPVPTCVVTREYLIHLSPTRTATALAMTRSQVREALSRETARLSRSDGEDDKKLHVLLVGLRGIRAFGRR